MLRQRVPHSTLPEQVDFLSGTETWGDKKRDAIYLNYSFSNGVYTYSATDTLVIRDRDCKT